MSEMPSGAVPEWDVADRMRKALRESSASVQEMADYLDVSRNTVGNWINGHVAPSTQTMRLWAIRCGVSFDWLKGAGNDRGPTPGSGMETHRFTPLPGLRKAPRKTHFASVDTLVTPLADAA